MSLVEFKSLSPVIQFAVSSEGIKETRKILPPTLEGLTQEQSQAATEEYFGIRLKVNSEELISQHPGVVVSEIIADSEEIARYHYADELGSTINRLRSKAEGV